MLNREDLEDREASTLSRVALLSRQSRGRRVHEDEDSLRTCFQRDRDRVLHSTAFRRLQQKTQVFLASEGDHYRTRLTHSLEVSQMARSVCLALGLNADLGEAVALAHDLGHPPFGHAGEHHLDERMRSHGGFAHNAQGLRILDLLESRKHPGVGLNLCWETRVCLFKRSVPEGFPVAEDLPQKSTPFLEGQVVDLCDRIAYVCHDVDDALRSGLVRWDVFAEHPLCAEAHEQATRSLETSAHDELALRSSTVGTMIRLLVRDIVVETDAEIESSRALKTPADVRAHGIILATHSRKRREEVGGLLRLLDEHFYKNAELLRTIEEATSALSTLFDRVLAAPEMLPPGFNCRIAVDGIERTVCDYVSGMTDRYVLRLSSN